MRGKFLERRAQNFLAETRREDLDEALGKVDFETEAAVEADYMVTGQVEAVEVAVTANVEQGVETAAEEHVPITEGLIAAGTVTGTGTSSSFFIEAVA